MEAGEAQEEDEAVMLVTQEKQDVRAQVNQNIEEIQKQDDTLKKFWARSTDTETRVLLDGIIEKEKDSNWQEVFMFNQCLSKIQEGMLASTLWMFTILNPG